MLLISSTLPVSQLLMLSVVSFLQFANIEPMLFTLDVFHPLRSSVVRDSQPQNIVPISVTLDVLRFPIPEMVVSAPKSLNSPERSSPLKFWQELASTVMVVQVEMKSLRFPE